MKRIRGLTVRASRTGMAAAAMAVLTAGYGLLLLQDSSAASFSAAVEAETGAPGGTAAVTAIGGASGGDGVRFGAGSGPVPGAPTAFGTLVSLPARSQAESAAGVKVAMVEFWWRELEPAEGQFDATYLNHIKGEINTHIAAGRRVTLGLGMHAAPAWMKDVPGSRYVNEDGQQSGEEDYNMVFSQKVRDKAVRYLTKLDAELDFSRIWGVRLTSGSNAEMMYPEGGFWAYDANARNGADMPRSMQRNPYPDFRPGSSSHTTAQARQWAEWYIGALGDVTDFQMKTIDALGFRGYYEIMSAGAGVRPSHYERAIADKLAGEDLLGRGVAWHRYYALLPDKDRVVAYSTSVAEQSMGPGMGDSCLPADRSVPIGSAMDSWSTARFISRIADEYGMRKGGENPGAGMPPIPEYGDTGPDGMMAASFRYASSCKFHVFYWAHDHNLYDGDVQFSDYAAGIRTATGGVTPLPPMP